MSFKNNFKAKRKGLILHVLVKKLCVVHEGFQQHLIKFKSHRNVFIFVILLFGYLV